MKKPYRFANEKELSAELRKTAWKECFKRGRLEQKHSDLEKIVHDSVGANTFRAFHHMPKKPSDTFRTWGLKALDKERLQSLREVRSQSEYTKWLYRLQDHFRRFWKRQMQNDIHFGASLKIPNLLVKQLCLWHEISDEDCKRIIRYLEVPLDIYTIQALANCVDAFPGKAYIGAIPESATMKFVRNLEMYEAFQNGIRDIAEKAGVAPITLDFWREAFLRPKTSQRYSE